MCSLFGLIDYGHTLSEGQKNRIVAELATACEERGTDATGIAYNSRDCLRIYKRPLAAHLMQWQVPADSTVVMGHTRLTTQGNAKHNFNNHPFYGKCDVKFALAHNGMLFNDKELRPTHRLPKTKIETDSYVAVQLLTEQKHLDFNSLAYMAEQLDGTFTFTILDEENSLYFVKGDNPMCIYHYPKAGVYIYASLETLLLKALNRLPYNFGKATKIDLFCGDILRINSRGKIAMSYFDPEKLLRNPSYFGFWTKPFHFGSNKEYVTELKAAAAGMGFCSEDIDCLLAEGCTLDEIEEMLYCGAV